MLFLITLGIGWINVPKWLFYPILVNAGIGLLLFLGCFLMIKVGNRSNDLKPEYPDYESEVKYYRRLTTDWLFIAVCSFLFGIPGLIIAILAIIYIS